MSKDKIAHVHARTMPYATPRRPLHVTEPASFNGRPVRQAEPYGPMLNPCTWTGPNETTCATTSFPQRLFSTFRSTDASDANWTPSRIGDGGWGLSCAQFACQNNYTDITNKPPYVWGWGVAQTDARCCVAEPPQAWTMQPDITYFRSLKGGLLRDKNGTSVYPTPNEAARLLWERGHYDYNPKNYHDCSYNPDGYGPISITNGFGPPVVHQAWFDPKAIIGGFGAQAIPGAKIYDVDPSACSQGFTDTQVAKSIQSSLGLFNTPTPTPVATSSTTQPEPSSQDISQTQSLATSQTTSQTKSITPTVVATTASAGILSTLAAFVTPVPTAVIAASAPATTVTGLAIGLGVLGSGVVIGAASFAGYKLAQYCRTETPATTNTENIYEDLEMNKKEVTDEPAWANLSECPFERPFAD